MRGPLEAQGTPIGPDDLNNIAGVLLRFFGELNGELELGGDRF